MTSLALTPLRGQHGVEGKVVVLAVHQLGLAQDALELEPKPFRDSQAFRISGGNTYAYD